MPAQVKPVKCFGRGVHGLPQNVWTDCLCLSRSGHSRPLCGRRSVYILRPTPCGRRAADVQPTHCGRCSICRSNDELVCVGRVCRMHQSSFQESYCSVISKDFQCFLTVMHASTHYSNCYNNLLRSLAKLAVCGRRAADVAADAPSTHCGRL